MIISIPKVGKVEFLFIKNEDVVGIISSRSNNRETRKNYAILSSFGLNIEKTIKSIKIEQEKAKHIQEEKSKIEIPKDEELVYDDIHTMI